MRLYDKLLRKARRACPDLTERELRRAVNKGFLLFFLCICVDVAISGYILYWIVQWALGYLGIDFALPVML